MREDFERDAEHLAREAEREARRAERDIEREERRAGRERERAERHSHRMGLLGRTVTVELDEGGPEQSATVERRFTVSGMPRLRVRNVSGYTRVGVGAPGEVLVRAHKHVRGWSPERAKRLLENVEVRMEQDGDEIVVEPQLHEQERGWLDLFRGGRVAVDFEVAVPREAQIEASTVSGPLRVRGTRGPVEARTVSGAIELDDVQGPVRLRTVSGDTDVRDYAGKVEANSTSGDLRFERARVKRPDLVTVSGDIRIEGAVIAGESDGRIKSVSGDVDMHLGEAALELEFQTLSGDLDVDLRGSKIEKRGRREWTVLLGGGGGRVKVKTVSGDLTVRGAGAEQPPEAEPAVEEVSAEAAPAEAARSEVVWLLERLARGEISVDEAASALDERR